MIACIGEPISWPRLERFATSKGDQAIAAHLAHCPACTQCLTEITGDLVALPVLVMPKKVPEKKQLGRWWWFAVPALAAATIAVMIIRPKPAELDRRPNVATVKGTGEITLALVRERAGTIVEDATTFARGDRWKVVVTCAPGHATWLDVSVVEAGAKRADHPLPVAELPCGNRIVMPGAFELTGHVVNEVCVRVSGAEGAPSFPTPGPDVACLTVTPE
ncbi:hypothetical protein BH11MYX1_BH11MYX1_40170 [soil metagenome]